MLATLLLSLFLSSAQLSAVKVVVAFPDGTAAYGSGVVVAVEKGKSLVVTNRHVCSGVGTVSIEYHEAFYAARHLASSPQSDLSVVVVSGTLPAALSVADSVPAPGSLVYYGGFPGGESLQRAVGVVHGVNGWTPTAGTIWWFACSVKAGDSGSGVFDGDGRLVAIVWGTHKRYGASVHLSELRLFLTTLPGWDGFRNRIGTVEIPVPADEPFTADR